MKQGDLVVRRSYGGDITFRVDAFYQDSVVIKGTQFRLLADSPVKDLVRVSQTTIKRRTEQAQIKMMESVKVIKQYQRTQSERRHTEFQFSEAPSSSVYFDMPGKVLHLDGDPNYLQKSLAIYSQLRVPVEGHYVHETNMAELLQHLLPRVYPDVVVITGHDGVLKGVKNRDLYSLQSYKNSQYFVNAVQTARRFERHLDLLTIVAGACQSHFEALLRSGANFASSPGRIMIHALDPVYVAVKASYTSIRETVQITDVMSHTMTGLEGLGGIETRGSHRIGMPKWKDLSSLHITPSII